MPTRTVNPYHLSTAAHATVRAAMPSNALPLQRAQRDLQAQAVRLQRAAAHRTAPFWPFGDLTPAQQRGREAQEQAMREGRLL